MKISPLFLIYFSSFVFSLAADEEAPKVTQDQEITCTASTQAADEKKKSPIL